MIERRVDRINRIYLQWHITNKCLNRCKHCYQDRYNGIDLTISDAKIILSDFMSCCDDFNAMPVIALTGGNPMLNKDFWEILAEVRRQAQFDCVSVLGNPENLGPKEIDRLKDAKLKHYQLSIDGIESTHDKMRYDGSFKRTLRATEDLSSAGIPVYIMTTVSIANLHEIPEVMKIVYDSGAMHWMFARWIPRKGDCGIPPEQYLAFVQEILREHKQYEKKGYKKLKKEPLVSVFQNDKNYRKGKKIIHGGCGMGSSTITMLPDKTLMACRRHPGSAIGKWSEAENFLFHFTENTEMEKYRDISKIEGCGTCEFLKVCRGCRAAAFVATGSDFGRDPQCPLNK